MRLNQYHCIFHKDYKKEIDVPVLSKRQLPQSQQNKKHSVRAYRKPRKLYGKFNFQKALSDV